MQAIVAQLASMAAKIDELIARERALEATVESMDERTLPCKFVINIVSSRWHVEAEPTGCESNTLRAVCGWKF